MSLVSSESVSGTGQDASPALDAGLLGAFDIAVNDERQLSPASR